MKTAFWFCVGFLVLGLTGHGADSTLVNMGELWSYSQSVPPQTPVGTHWTELNFDDSKWSMARSGFDLENSRPSLQDTQPSRTPSRVFLRHRFFLDDPTAIRSLRLKVEHEQGFIAYLNGKRLTEVTASGVTLVHEDPQHPEEQDAVLTLADVDLTQSRTLLQKGENVIALEGVQSWTSLSPVTLSGLLTANISRGPFVQNNTTNSIVIAWRTDLALDSTVEYGRTMALGRSSNLANLTTDHAITLTDLESDTQYFYRVVSRGGDDTVASDIDFFQTFRAQGPVHFAFIADTGQNTAAQTAQAQVLARLAPELVLHGGDIIYGGFDDKTPDTRVFAQYLRQTGQMKNTPFYFTIGNHDLNCCGGSPAEWNPKDILLNAPHFQQTFYLPTNSATGTEHFYSFDQGDAHFVGLYNPWFTVYDFNATTLQYQWLTNDLAHSSKPWKILFFHSPIAHSGEHSLADRNVNGILDQVEVMQLISQASRSYGVQLVLCGHDHNFERFAPTNGLHAVVAGGGGAGLYQFTSRHPLSSQFLKANHCLNIEIVGDTASVQTVTTNGVILDQFVIHRSLPLEPTYYSEWNTPRVEVDPANDKDGNINGQTFDLIGKPILPRHGDFSNLGFAYVNNDSTNLYVGFASVMIPDDANVFLFAGSSRRSGVETMNGVGNGVIDPLGEGVDGLDCLENLAFSGFRPLVGCVLGDEFGDSNLRSSLRPSLTLNIGQGVFGLGPRLDPVVGSRLQQFNRSPQTNALDMRSTSAAYEQNADYIEVAIPFSALGDVIPGDTIQLAALVGLRGYDPAAMTRSLDNAALASSVTVRSDGMTVVAPIQVKLAFPKDLDTDGDGLPDAWEIANGLRPDDASGDNGAAGDPDQDGDSNLREFLAGTDPRDPNSSLRIRLVPTGDSRFRLQWAPVVGRRLTIQYASPDPVGFGDYFRAPEAPRAPLFKAVLTEDLRGRSGPYQRYYRLRLDP